MRKYLVVAFAAVILTGETSAQVNLPAPSPTQTIRQDFGTGRVELTYSRPSIRGRSLFENNSLLAPLGKPWRTGANAATRIRFSDNVTIGGKTLDSGSYVIYTVPNKPQWEVVFSKGTAYPGGQGFSEGDDVVRVKATPVNLKDKVETFTMQFANIQNETADLQIIWGNSAVTVPIKTNIKDKLRAQVEEAMKGEKKPYQLAANYYYEWEKDYAKALENVNRAIEGNPKAFWLYLLKAKIQKDAGDKAGATASANKTIEVATEAKNDDYVRMAKELLKG